jgi:hypothetical protein
VAVNFLTPNNKALFVLMYWGFQEAEQDYAEELQGIVKSISKP